MPEEKKDKAPENPTFGASPFDGKSSVSIQDQLNRKIESIPHDQVQATYDAALKALEEQKAAPGAALKKVGGFLLGLLSPIK